MKAENIDSIPINWLDKSALKGILFWALIYLGIIWAIAPLLYRPLIQPFGNEFILHGHGLASIAIWGYSLLILLLGNVDRVVMLQSVVGSVAIAALMVRLNCLLPRAKTIITILFILALPWLSYMSFAYQQPMSSAFMILALLAMEMALLSGKITWGVVAGVLGGIGQNFRSELVILPAVILLVVFVLRRLQWINFPTIKPLVVSVTLAMILQLPWAFHCYFNAGRFSLSESNLGHTTFVELGYLSSNPWHILPKDAFVQETVNKAGFNFSSLSFQGSDFLMNKFIDNVKQHPSAYLECLGVRMWETVTHPFSSIPLDNPTSGMNAIHEIVISDHVLANTDPLKPSYKTVSKIEVVIMWVYYILNGILNRAISILGILGFFIAFRKGPFRLSQPLILICSITVLYRCGLNIAIGASGKYMTSVYLCYLPFVVNTLWFAYQQILHARSKRLKSFKNYEP